mmetsp:Transcript_25661/g.85664  ORF Transcript_25661/g.85664 Transcript_25661/m.85664 type:complete len:238 (-) Transcript_25661:449-1162(-)
MACLNLGSTGCKASSVVAKTAGGMSWKRTLSTTSRSGSCHATSSSPGAAGTNAWQSRAVFPKSLLGAAPCCRSTGGGPSRLCCARGDREPLMMLRSVASERPWPARACAHSTQVCQSAPASACNTSSSNNSRKVQDESSNSATASKTSWTGKVFNNASRQRSVPEGLGSMAQSLSNEHIASSTEQADTCPPFVSTATVPMTSSPQADAPSSNSSRPSSRAASRTSGSIAEVQPCCRP